MISIALPVFNRAEIMPKFLNSALAQTYDDFEIIIVDDGSTDNSYKVGCEYVHKDSRIKCYRHPKNLGVPSARNTAIEHSHGEFIYFGEDDVVLDCFCLEKLVNTFVKLKETCKVGAVGPRLVSNAIHNKKSDSVCHIDSLTGDFIQDWSNSTHFCEVPFLHACSLFSREVFKVVGGYNISLYRGNYTREESDMYFRAKQAGFKLFYEPKALAWHYHFSKGGCRLSNLKYNYYSVRNHVLFTAKFQGLKAFYMIPFYCMNFGLLVANARLSNLIK